MEKLKLNLGKAKERLTRAQMKNVTGGYMCIPPGGACVESVKCCSHSCVNPSDGSHAVCGGSVA
ncbi:hypothetical protein [Mucilaginibacter lappiensis]|uniref:Bacteriocin-type signal sequence-containing protein n=1 Tax=Mucilaginibacter lappiensis TaxID=354630 RepID=A0A841JEG2_9SPHI|nr:hypothetical protein [Mucilaginibacter lappiensis]MBB6128692.1 hypothetical protein [Mucilaginibacter lappiensis]